MDAKELLKKQKTSSILMIVIWVLTGGLKAYDICQGTNADVADWIILGCAVVIIPLEVFLLVKANKQMKELNDK